MKILLSFLFILSSLSASSQDPINLNTPSNELFNPQRILQIDNIETLRGLTDLVQGDMAYVQGYYNVNDRGGGFFYYLDAANAKGITPDRGMNIAPFNGIGLWKRINYNEISVAYFGAKGGDTLDDTAAIQEAIDFVGNYFKTSAPKGGTVYFPKGTYYVTELILRNRVSLLGQFGGTIIKPSKNSEGKYNNSLVRLDDGFVEYIRIEGFMFYGDVFTQNADGSISTSTEEVDMNCFEFNADQTDGGLWFSNLKNISISKFKKDGIRFIGGTDYELNNIYNRVNQFITLENVRVIKPMAIESRSLYMFGQNAQVNFVNCSFSGTHGNASRGTNVWIESTSQDPDGANDPGPQTSLLNFDTCTFEHSELGIRMQGAYAININECWFENLDKAVELTGFSKGITISGNKFSNAGKLYLLLVENSGVTFTNNLVRQPQKVSIIKRGSDRHYFGKNNYRETPGTRDYNYFN